MGRRTFLRLGAAAGIAGVASVASVGAVAGIGRVSAGRRSALHPTRLALRVGVILPASDAARIGADFGRREAEHAAALFGTGFDVIETTADSAAEARAVAAAMVADGGMHALVGGATPEAADVLMDIAEDARVLFFNVGAARESLRTRCGAMTFHLLPSDAMRRDALAAAPDAPAGSRAVGWHATLSRFGAAQVNERFRHASGTGMSERDWTAWLALKVLFDAGQRVGTADVAAIAAHLVSERARFDGHKGIQLSFRRESHQLRQPLYVVADDAVVAEVPSVRGTGASSAARLLDTIGGGDTCTG